MRINKVILILMLPLMVELIVACCDCLEPTYFNYTNCNLTTSNIDNSGAYPIISQSDSIPKEAYGIRIVIDRKENTCYIKENKSIFFQSAYATSCDCPPELQYLPLDSIVSIKIITKRDFDSNHMENSNVSEYFYVFDKNKFYTIDKYIENIKTTLYDFENPKLEFDLLLMTPPTIGIEHQFQVTVILSDNRILNSETEIIKLF